METNKKKNKVELTAEERQQATQSLLTSSNTKLKKRIEETEKEDIELAIKAKETRLATKEAEELERTKTLETMEQERLAKKEEQPMQRETGTIEKIGEFGKKVPLVGSAFKLGGKLATAALGTTGIWTPETIQNTKDWWGGRITVGDVVGTALFAGSVALGVGALGAKATGTRATTALSSPKFGGIFKSITASASKVNLMTRFQLKTAVKAGWILAKTHPGKAFAIATAHQGITITTSWFAGDNLLTLASMATNNLADQVRFGNITSEEAIDELDAATSDVNSARWGFRIGASTNPLLYPLWAMEEIAAISIKRKIERQREIIERG